MTADKNSKDDVSDLSKRAKLEAGYCALFQNISEGVAIYEAVNEGEDFVIVEFNKAAERITGFSKHEVTGRTVSEMFPTVMDLGLFDKFQEVWRTGEPAHHPVSQYLDDRIQIWVDNYVYKLPSGEVVAVFSDETRQKRTEEALRESRDLLRILMDSLRVGILYVDPQERIVFANQTFGTWWGRPGVDLSGCTVRDILGDHYAVIQGRIEAVLIGQEIAYEETVKYKDGVTRDISVSYAPHIAADGQIKGIACLIADITSLKRREEAQRRLSTAVEQAAEAIVITDIGGNIQYVNPAFERITGYSRQEAMGENPKILNSGEHDKKFYEKLWKTITNGESWAGRFVNKKKDGTLYREDATISPVRDSSGRIVNYVAVKRDITREIELQKQLTQAQKMEAIGTLAGGIAHDFNNLLQVVIGYSDLLLSDKQEDPGYAGLKKIYEAGKKGADLVQKLLTLSRKAESELRPVNLNDEIIQAQGFLSRTIPKTIKIQAHLSDNLAAIMADSSQLGQILMNMAVNARDAMPDGGTLIFETANIELDQEYCSIHLEATPGSYVLLTVTDSGSGMDKETMSHIFEPFFTTKEKEKGTGLGLATVYGIVKQQGGFINCYSEPRLGTTFRAYFPAIEAKTNSDIQTKKPFIIGGSETILLVDDEHSVLEVGKNILSRLGYDVITACDGKEALEIYKMETGRISLVILDVIMPEMDGKQCLVEILRFNPNARVLMSSGHSEHAPINGAQANGSKGFVGKPYNMAKLLEKVRHVLDEG